jgi:chemotaxis protein CheY-P-specific phosphatase CheC
MKLCLRIRRLSKWSERKQFVFSLDRQYRDYLNEITDMFFRSIYTQISQALGDHPEAAVYSEKTAEILPAMRFCAYKTGAELKISDLASEYQSAAIEAMIAQRPKMSEITFRNNKISVPNEKIAALLVKIEEFEKKVDKKVEMYEEILIELRDVIQTVRDTTKVEQVWKDQRCSFNIIALLKVNRTDLLFCSKGPKLSHRCC